MTISELEQQLLQLPPNEKVHIIQLLTQSLATHNTHPEYPHPQFYGCIQDETLFRHPQGEQAQREAIL